MKVATSLSVTAIILNRMCCLTRENGHMLAAIRDVVALLRNAIRGSCTWASTISLLPKPVRLNRVTRRLGAKYSIRSIPMKSAWQPFPLLTGTGFKVKEQNAWIAVLFCFCFILLFFKIAYAVIPLSAESVNRMTQRSGLSLQQLLTDRNLALQPCESMDTVADSSTSSNVEDNVGSIDNSKPSDGDSISFFMLKSLFN